MMLTKSIVCLFILSSIDSSIYVYNTEDSLSVEYYDCIYYESMLYCRRPKEPISLQRTKRLWNCSNHGIIHSFQSLSANNITVDTVLHKWKSGIDKAEDYSYYQNQMIKFNDSNQYLCECNDPRSFGVNCEYLLPDGTTFADAATEKIRANSTIRKYGGDIVCYITLQCNSGLLCLDWREICDGIQNCMSGYDEENCDKLEFNECEKDEYRCMNGMCIPDEYFLDGEYDCMDMSDEKELFIDLLCPFQLANFNCDERICNRYHWACGDGQCITDRNAFRSSYMPYSSLCISRRDQFYMCEANPKENLWTSPNGQCYEVNEYEELNRNNFSIDEYCIYIYKCFLSSGAEKYCPCGKFNDCDELFINNCSSLVSIQYPKLALVAPYAFEYVKITYDPLSFSSFWKLNGSIKCRGYMANFSSNEEYLTIHEDFDIRGVEFNICTLIPSPTMFSRDGYDQFCHNDSKTFNNYSYNFIDVCKDSGECIVSYRINDGTFDCYNSDDHGQENDIVLKSCSNVQHHRFYCSRDEPTCLDVSKLDIFGSVCSTYFDGSWMDIPIMSSRLHCNHRVKSGCQDIRRYIEASWQSSNHSHSSLDYISSEQIPFRSYCDTFWDLSSKEDENRTLCQSLWICPQDQWQCYTGQCILYNWVLDGEWDCPDASDEQNIYAVNFNSSHHNYLWIKNPELRETFIKKYEQQPFGKTCNLTVEYPCLPINISYFSNTTKPCINLELIGDGKADCIGGYDERSNINHCDEFSTLGNSFKCLIDNICIPSASLCEENYRCPNKLDDDIWCRNYETEAQFNEFQCENGVSIRNNRCDGKYDCLDGEDEYMCYKGDSIDIIYRKEKDLFGGTEQQKLRLPQFPTDTKTTEAINTSVTIGLQPTLEEEFNTSSLLPPYWCNRGIGAFISDGSIVCFCPPQYHGDQCQFHSDRITVFLHLNLTNSIYTTSTDETIIIKLLILFLFHNQVLGTDEFHIRPATEIDIYKKKKTYFHYSRSSQSLQTKQKRYFNRSDIIDQHPYSIRIEAYEMKIKEKPRRFAVWQYPIYFDYLPVYRFAKTLRLTKPNEKEDNLCQNKPCNENEECYSLMNDKSQYICLCKNNYFGRNCSKIDSRCTNNYCSTNAVCQPSYRSSSNAGEFPYCICPIDYIGQRCELVHSICSSNPCKNNGTCYQRTRPNEYNCECTDEYGGRTCEERKESVILHINRNNITKYDGIVVQYFNIDLWTFKLQLAHQSVYSNLPNSFMYFHSENIAPEIILVKMYWLRQLEIYLISLHINKISIEGNTSITEQNRCMHVHSLFPNKKDISIFHYHHICRNNHSLFCFRDDQYICICDKAHYRTECFHYDYKLDQCSQCFANGHCLKGRRKTEYICICPACHTGKACQFNFESFSFTLDQLFFNDLLSKYNTIRRITFFLLIIIPCILFLLGLVNNIFCFVTFRRPKCLRTGIGHYLFYMSIINQINLTILLIRLIHLTLNITNGYSHLLLNHRFCQILSYLLICSTRIIYWFSSLIAIQRIYVTLVLDGGWLRKPHITRRLILLTVLIILIISSYELAFIESQISSDNGQNAMCVLNFPSNYSFWKELHKAVTIINALLPFVINLCCTIGIICVVTKKKMNASIRDNNKPSAVFPTTKEPEEIEISNKGTDDNELPTVQSAIINIVQPLQPDLDILRFQLSNPNTQFHIRLLLGVITEHKEIIVAPAITLIPQLFSLPFFIASFLLGCQDLSGNQLRYLLIISYLTIFIPPLTSFFLYISPSTFYSKEWHATNMGKWFKTFKQRYYPVTLPTKK